MYLIRNFHLLTVLDVVCLIEGNCLLHNILNFIISAENEYLEIDLAV